MTHTVGLIHAVIPAMPPVRDAFARLLPDVRVLNLLDEALLKEAERLGGIGPVLVRRMTGLVALHEAAGAELVLFTCNAYSPYVDQVQAQAAIPVLTIDQALLDKALATGKRLGVLATVTAGLEQQSKSIDRAAAAAGVKVELTKVLRADAFAALNAGDEATPRSDSAGGARQAGAVGRRGGAGAGLDGRADRQAAGRAAGAGALSPQLAVAKVKEMLKS